MGNIVAKKKSNANSKTSNNTYRITVSCEVRVLDAKGKPTKDLGHLRLLDGFYYRDSMCDHIYGKGLEDALTGGVMRCQLDEAKKKLFLVVDFSMKTKPSKTQLNHLHSECIAQCSDGMGGDFFDDFERATGMRTEPQWRQSTTKLGKGEPFRWDKSTTAALKQLNADWKKAGKTNKPKGSADGLLQCFRAIQNEKHATLDKLLQSGTIDVSAACKRKHEDYDNKTLLIYAARIGNDKAVRTLLSAGADPNQKCEEKYGDKIAPLHTAKNAKVIRALLEGGADPNIKTFERGNTPLIQTEIIHVPESVRVLLEYKANPNAKNDIKQTPVHMAGVFNLESAQILIDAGGKPDVHTVEYRISHYTGKDDKVLKTVKVLVGDGSHFSQRQIVSLRRKAEECDLTSTAKYLSALIDDDAAAPSTRTKKPTTRKKASTKKKVATKKKTANTAKTTKSKPSTKGTKMSTRRFEFSDDKSNKFWEITISGTEHTVRYGRIGTDGQSKTKAFDDAEACQVAADKLIEQKTGKGYKEV